MNQAGRCTTICGRVPKNALNVYGKKTPCAVCRPAWSNDNPAAPQKPNPKRHDAGKASDAAIIDRFVAN